MPKRKPTCLTENLTKQIKGFGSLGEIAVPLRKDKLAKPVEPTDNCELQVEFDAAQEYD